MQRTAFPIDKLGACHRAELVLAAGDAGREMARAWPQPGGWLTGNAWRSGCSVLCSVAQPCLTLRDPMDYSPPGTSGHAIPQAAILEWVAMPSSRGSSPPGIKPRSPTLQADSLPSEPPGKPWRSGCTNAIGQTRVPALAGPQASFPQHWPASGPRTRGHCRREGRFSGREDSPLQPLKRFPNY